MIGGGYTAGQKVASNLAQLERQSIVKHAAKLRCGSQGSSSIEVRVKLGLLPK